MKKLYFRTREDWRKWLSENHHIENEVWLVFYKKGTGQESIGYDDSVEEALCFGWVDSIIKKLDGKTYARKFTPRRAKSAWSEINKKRAEKMLESGLMTEFGLRLVNSAKKSGAWDRKFQRPQLSYEMLPEFKLALDANQKARETFLSLSATDKKQYLGWIEIAKRPGTRSRRISESIRLLEEGKKLGLR